MEIAWNATIWDLSKVFVHNLWCTCAIPGVNGARNIGKLGKEKIITSWSLH